MKFLLTDNSHSKYWWFQCAKIEKWIDCWFTAMPKNKSHTHNCKWLWNGDFLLKILALCGWNCYNISINHDDREAFLVPFSCIFCCNNVKLNQNSLNSSFEVRLEPSKTDELTPKNTIRKQQWARGNSNPGPPPCEGDVITS